MSSPSVCKNGLSAGITLNRRRRSAMCASAMLGLLRDLLPGKQFYFPLSSRVYGDRTSVIQPFGMCVMLPSDFPPK